MELLTERLCLRPCREPDLESLTATIGEPAVSDWLCNLPQPYTLADAREFMQRTAAPGAGWEGIIALRDSGTLVGGVRLTIVGDKEADLGYWVARARWGRGYATEAAVALLEWGFHELALQRVIASTLPGNLPSQRVLRQLGFRYTGMRPTKTGTCGTCDTQRVPHYLLERPTR
ncbi:MAG: hypothetical protein BEU05_02630 [Marine Group III euryarchaeote CG-Bathy2]|uniref:Acetyltransferase, ribosomal protein N-acetylase n=2 Tax=Methanobacteriati TaxID=3366610 RepID=A0A075GT70_9EURY|nr:acetyltransferase, ribosomal protein N-acetylase [uncultured marine group II/III euryarchaeote KM3_190_A12]OIR09387.1 MAG: hypothetical protein BEU05_02630 [Marine Group III euryarchaeote CG-Bathy2]